MKYLIYGFYALLILFFQSLLAKEFIVFKGDKTFQETDKGFMYYAGRGMPLPVSTWPDNWKSPDDYWNGHWEVRYVVKSTPKDLPFTLQTCIWEPDKDENCSSPYTAIQGPGTYTGTLKTCSSWWKKDGKPVDYTNPAGFDRLGLVFRTKSGCYVTPYNVSPNCWAQRADYIPVPMHITIVAVSAGSTFSGWDNYPVDGTSIRHSRARLKAASSSQIQFYGSRIFLADNSAAASVTIEISDLQGRRIQVLKTVPGKALNLSETIDARGTYLVNASCDGVEETGYVIIK
jgi:hypothetical protein